MMRFNQFVRTIKKDFASETSGMEAAETVASLVNDIAQEVLGSVLRSASLHLSNKCKNNILINPQVYTSSGYSYDPRSPRWERG
ncbi:hypothetical protein COCON_G00070940 [Conger conger]|uniref:Uncharacterized protein n=1 Tax=Conger conger TaxID=82655 RepID=A0A9Q1DT99_CONCO|nr:hypothetical protein COCON_G00070940 [Conger conger]